MERNRKGEKTISHENEMENFWQLENFDEEISTTNIKRQFLHKIWKSWWGNDIEKKL